MVDYQQYLQQEHEYQMANVAILDEEDRVRRKNQQNLEYQSAEQQGMSAEGLLEISQRHERENLQAEHENATWRQDDRVIMDVNEVQHRQSVLRLQQAEEFRHLNEWHAEVARRLHRQIEACHAHLDRLENEWD